MDDDSLVSLGGLGRGHIDRLRPREHTQAVGSFILAVGELETHGVRDNGLGNDRLNPEVVARIVRGNAGAGSKKRYRRPDGRPQVEIWRGQISP